MFRGKLKQQYKHIQTHPPNENKTSDGEELKLRLDQSINDFYPNVATLRSVLLLNAVVRPSVSSVTVRSCILLRRLKFSSMFSCHGTIFSVHVHDRYIVRPSVCRLSVVCNVGAPYSGDWNFPQYFYAIWYLGQVGHPWPLYKNFTEIFPGEPLRRGS